jgi:uncharacterized membrane protein YphA (DoxX/SURF4 family)
VGVVVLIQVGMRLTQPSDAGIGQWTAGWVAVASGFALLTGFLTPLAAALTLVSAMVPWMYIAPAAGAILFLQNLLAAFLGAVAVAIVFLGPGGFSLDARLFGLREIVIPPRQHLRTSMNLGEDHLKICIRPKEPSS